jgi:hypothetical protein
MRRQESVNLNLILENIGSNMESEFLKDLKKIASKVKDSG